jgi:hypothetical protein
LTITAYTALAITTIIPSANSWTMNSASHAWLSNSVIFIHINLDFSVQLVKDLNTVSNCLLEIESIELATSAGQRNFNYFFKE